MSEKRSYKIQWARNTLMIAPSVEGERKTYVGIGPRSSLTPYTGVHLTPDQAAEAARALLGDDMVVVGRDVLSAIRTILADNDWQAAARSLDRYLGPEPCPAYIESVRVILGKAHGDAKPCTLPKGHDGDHIPPATAWTVPS